MPLLDVTSDKRLAMIRHTGVRMTFDRSVIVDGKVAYPGVPELASAAETFTEQFDDFAQEEPAFAAFIRMAQVVGLARWLADSSAADSIGWLAGFQGAEFKTPTTTPRIRFEDEIETERRQSVTLTSTLVVSGGVSMGGSPDAVVTDGGLATLLQGQITPNVSSRKVGSRLLLDVAGTQYVGIVLQAASD